MKSSITCQKFDQRGFIHDTYLDYFLATVYAQSIKERLLGNPTNSLMGKAPIDVTSLFVTFARSMIGQINLHKLSVSSTLPDQIKEDSEEVSIGLYPN